MKPYRLNQGPTRRSPRRAFSLLLAVLTAGPMAQAATPPSACTDPAALRRASTSLRAGLNAASDAWALRHDEVLATLARDQLLARIAELNPAPGETELDAAVAERSKPQPERLQLRHIFRRIPQQASAAERTAVRTEMQGYLEQLQAGADLAELARKHSDSESATAGGLVRAVARNGLEPSLAERLWSLGPGQLSGIVDTPLGLHIFRVESRIAAQQAAPIARESLRTLLQQKAVQQAYRDFLQTRTAALGLQPHTQALLPPLPQRGATAPVALSAPVAPLPTAQLLARWRAQEFGARRENGLEALLGQDMEQRVLRSEAYCSGLPRTPEAQQALRAARLQWRDERALQRLAARASERELRAFYARHVDDPKRWRQPEQRRLRAVVVSFDVRSPHGVYEELDRLKRELATQPDTALIALAANRSSDPSSADGGDLGWVDAQQLAIWAGPRFAEAVNTAPTGALLGPLMVEIYETAQFNYRPQAYALVRVEAVRPAGLRTYEEVETLVRRQYAQAQLSAKRAGSTP